MSSGALTWLHGQRKVELLTIAEKVGLKGYDKLLKSELEAALDEHMRANQSTLSSDRSLQPYFRRVSGSPLKKDFADTETKTPRPRRTTKDKDDPEQTDLSETETSSKAIVARTPRMSVGFASSVPLPPSPAVVAEQIDRQTAKVRSSISKYWVESGIVEASDSLRDKLSSTVTIESLALVIELWGMQKDILPIKSLALIPSSTMLGTPEIPAKVPDLFVLLSSEFWTTFSLWLTTSVLLPVMFSYFFNLTLKAKHGGIRHAKNMQPAAQYDPLTFNISKALIAWLVYAQGMRLGGWVNAESVDKLETAIPGGHQGVLIGAGIGALTSIYEAVLKK